MFPGNRETLGKHARYERFWKKYFLVLLTFRLKLDSWITLPETFGL